MDYEYLLMQYINTPKNRGKGKYWNKQLRANREQILIQQNEMELNKAITTSNYKDVKQFTRKKL